DVAGTEVGEHVHAVHARDAIASVDVAAGDRAVAAAVGVLVHRRNRTWCSAGGVVHVVAFEARPAEVHAGGRHTRCEVDLLPRVLAHVADPHAAGGPVEAEAPGIAQPERPHRVLTGGRVHAQDLPEGRALVLGVVAGIS